MLFQILLFQHHPEKMIVSEATLGLWTNTVIMIITLTNTVHCILCIQFIINKCYELFTAKSPYGEKAWRQMVLRRIVRTAKCTYGEMYVRQNVRTAKCTYGEMYVRQTVRTAKRRTAKWRTAKRRTANSPRTGFSMHGIVWMIYAFQNCFR